MNRIGGTVFHEDSENQGPEAEILALGRNSSKGLENPSFRTKNCEPHISSRRLIWTNPSCDFSERRGENESKGSAQRPMSTLTNPCVYVAPVGGGLGGAAVDKKAKEATTVSEETPTRLALQSGSTFSVGPPPPPPPASLSVDPALSRLKLELES
jgi:hypothetical protein